MISKEEASCLFYCKPFDENSAEECLKNIEASPEVDLCYTNNFNEAMLICKSRIYGAPNFYKLYKSKQEIAEETANNADKKNIIFENDSQIVDFINYVFRPKEENLCDPRYKLATVYDKDIMSVIWKFSHKSDSKTPLAFSQWLNAQKVDLTSTEPERKIVKTDKKVLKLRSRQLSTLDHVYYDTVAETIVEKLPRHQSKINEMKKDGYQIVGYCRKSVGETRNRIACLQRMVDILYKRSLVDKVFVSPVSLAKQQFAKRDLEDEKNEIMSKLNNTHGCTIDFLKFLEKNTKVCVISIDYAGLTTNSMDLKNLLREYPSLQKIFIDLFFYENQFIYFDNEQLLNNPEHLELFDCRPSPKQRGR
ncbi:hypothetical protein BDF20DRAFT_866255 [Mycotypha africana]|uniref:uncharacterized protein n=1 Tax=Mycotypha africana TaxID=64632 RepID=UPI002301BF9A|nr:uncharacterized protein BDF20DRAFT_866255 [Mycotypha africana]KAI8982322.1 hypothetical protein BDF20DRAFT_866255 [Mycotypha africana]